VSSLLFAVTMVVMRQPLLGQAPLMDYLIFIASGVIAIAASDILFHMCLNRVGAGLTAIVNTLYSPFIILFAFLMLGERLAWQQFLGMILIIGGVMVAAVSRRPESVSPYSGPMPPGNFHCRALSSDRIWP
jgi:drug/metabolite transporter (DMT)-like permease